MLTDGKSRNKSICWSNKGDRFAFASNKKNGKDTNVYIMPLPTTDFATSKEEIPEALLVVREVTTFSIPLIVNAYYCRLGRGVPLIGLTMIRC
jgi:hypothetical protein